MVRNIQYRTCFRAKSKRDSKDASKGLFRRIQEAFWYWIKDKEETCSDFFSNEENHKNFFHKTNVSDLGDQKANLVSAIALAEDEKAWCLRYTHYDLKVRNRRWCLEGGLHYFKDTEDTGEIVVAVTLMYEDLESNVIFEAVETPVPSVPGCILRIFSIPDVRFTLGGNNQYFGFANIPLKLDRVKDVVDFIKSNARRYPIIVFNGNKSRADELLKKVAGKAICMTLPEGNQKVFQAFVENLGRDSIGEKFRIPRDSLRVFFPFTGFVRSYEHPVIKLTSDDSSEQINRLIRLVLMNIVPCSDWAVSVEKMSDIIQLRKRAKRDLEEKEREAQRKKESERLDELLKKEKKNAEEFEELANIFEKEARDWEEKYNYIKNENDKLKQNALCSSGYSQPEMRNPEIRNPVIKDLPESFEKCVEIGESVFSNLEFSEDSKKSSSEAKDGKNPKNVRMLWKILWNIDSVLFNLKFNSGAVDLAREFKNQTGFHYSRGEGQRTNADSKLIRARKFFHKGRSFDKLLHVKPQGSLDWRVYFDYDNENRKIVIGHIGDHLDNATTRKLS